MAYTSVTLTGQVQASPGVGLPNAILTATLSHEISDGTSVVEPKPVAVTCDGSGNIPAGFALPANDDTTTTPQGTYYTFTVSGPGGVFDSWQAVVPHGFGSSLDLFSLARLSPGGGTYVATTVIDGGNAST